MTEVMMDDKNVRKPIRGGWNLTILGLASIVIALLTTGVSLAIYHNSGDIYLDRSRPGFLPDEKEIEQDDDDDDNKEYVFDKSGKMTPEVIQEYLKNFSLEMEAVDAYEKPFGEEIVSDEHLGIPSEQGGDVQNSAGQEAVPEG